MKTISTYSFDNKVSFNEELLQSKEYRPLGRLESQRLSVKPLFDETVLQNVENFTVVGFVYEERKEPDSEMVAEEVENRINEFPNVSEEAIAQIEEDVYTKLKYYAGTKKTNFKVYIDHTKGLMIFDTTRKMVDNVIGEVLSLLEDSSIGLSIVQPDAPIMENLLTEFIVTSKLLPDTMVVLDKVNLGAKSEFDKSPKQATIKIVKEDPESTQVMDWIKQGKVVKSLQIENDGGLEFTINNQFNITGGKFVEWAKVETDEELAPSVEFMQKAVVQLPLVFNTVESLIKAAKKVEI